MTHPKPRHFTTTAATLTAALLLLLTGCAGDADTATDTDTATTEASATATATTTSDTSAEEAEALADLEALYAEDARVDQLVAGAGVAQALELGFTRQLVATEEEISEARDAAVSRTHSMGLNSVEPGECTAPLNAVDWSPMLINTENVTRVDFTSDTFAGTGTVEVAGGGAGDDSTVIAEALADYEQAVETLVTDCAELRMSVADPSSPQEAPTMIEYQYRAEQVETPAGPALLWSRTPLDTNGQAVSALVLIGQIGDQALMVSFAGDTAVHDEEFQQIAAAIMGAMTTTATGTVE